MLTATVGDWEQSYGAILINRWDGLRDSIIVRRGWFGFGCMIAVERGKLTECLLDKLVMYY